MKDDTLNSIIECKSSTQIGAERGSTRMWTFRMLYFVWTSHLLGTERTDGQKPESESIHPSVRPSVHSSCPFFVRLFVCRLYFEAHIIRGPVEYTLTTQHSLLFIDGYEERIRYNFQCELTAYTQFSSISWFEFRPKKKGRTSSHRKRRHTFAMEAQPLKLTVFHSEIYAPMTCTVLRALLRERKPTRKQGISSAKHRQSVTWLNEKLKAMHIQRTLRTE